MKHLFFISAILLTFATYAQKKNNNKREEKTTKEEPKKWDITQAFGPSKDVEFSVKEGTWMNLDVSPDGSELVFDLLGDIYTMPITGGEAKCIASGLAYQVQPRYSHDGKKILFTSDAGGGDNIWYMDKDGKNAKAITKEDFRLLNNGVWMPDGQYIIARKHFTSTRSLGAGEMWMYHISGSSGIQLTKKRNDQMDTGEPCISPDGKYLYYSEDASPGSVFEYNKDPNGQIYVIRRYDMETGEIETITGGVGGACRPQISPDGKYLAFVKRVRFQSQLFVQNLETGEEFMLFDKLSRDQQETWALFGVYPNFDWLPDGKGIVIYGQGKLWNVPILINNQKQVLAAAASEIPFSCKVKQTIVEAVNSKHEPFTPEFEAKMIRHATTSPDGTTLVFVSNGHIYHKILPNLSPERLTNLSQFEFEPAYSKDGSMLVFTTWDDIEKGAIWKLNLTIPAAKPQKLTQEPGFYYNPSFGENDKKIIYSKGTGNSILGYAYDKNPGIYVMEASGKNPKLLSKEGDKPVLSNDGKKLYYTLDPGMNKSFKVRNLENGQIRTLATAKYGTDFLLSPNEKWLAFRELYQVYITAFPQTGQTIDLTGDLKSLPIKKVTRDAGTSLHWSGDSEKLHWVLGANYFTRELTQSFSWVQGGADSIPPVDTLGLAIGLKLKSDVPKNQIMLNNARIITMEGDKVIENGHILIVENKIERIGEGEGKVDGGVIMYIDCKGKTIIPGLIDVHAHLGSSYDGISPKSQWSYIANLAYGVTTTHDPSNNTEMVFSQAEMVETGEMIGPRIFSTGTILYGADGDFKALVNNLDDARSHLRRMKAVGAFSVKSYNQPRRDQRQQILKAARELNMNVYPEGGSTFFHNMTQVLDGHTGIEHSIPVADLHEDVVKLWAETKVAYTPTLIVAYGGIWGENYWYDKTNVWENKRLLQFMPRSILDQRSRRREKAPDEEYGHFQNTASCTKIAQAGTKVNLGAHGQLQGLGAHWELWMLQQGGMTPLAALRCATQNGADYLGMGHALGSISAGKLADLVILTDNPLENIQNSDNIDFVIKNGKVYRFDEKEVKNQHFWWNLPGERNKCEAIENMHSVERGHCGCGAH